MKTIYFISALLFSVYCKAQFPGPAGTPGTTAIHKDSSIFVAWASNCQVQRGWMDIANKSLGTTTTGINSDATGKAGENPIISLGDSGVAILTFDYPIINGPGFDFAVFENGFNDQFIELAFVEVSSDGINFFRFPSTSNTQTTSQIGPWDQVGDATKINNLAGKYRVNFGTPFDLEDLKNESGLDVNNITHIKIIDVVGSINPLYSSKDKNNNIINDPYPTDFANGGFDLDAVGIIHALGVGLKENNLNLHFNLFPNPIVNGNATIKSNEFIQSIHIFTLTGQIIKQQKDIHSHEINLSGLDKGCYLIEVSTENSKSIQKIIVY